MNYQPLKYIYKPSGQADAYTLLLLHGTGGDESDLLPMADHFGKNINILSIRGNVMENGMPRFFRRLAMGVFDEQDVEFRTHEMVHFMKELAIKEKFDSNKIIALGYSNGANIAGSTLLLYPELLAGAILFRPMQPLTQSVKEFKTSRQQPVFLSSGKFDPTVNPTATSKYIALLKSGNFKVTHVDLEAGHNLTQQDLQLATDWFKSNFDL